MAVCACLFSISLLPTWISLTYIRVAPSSGAGCSLHRDDLHRDDHPLLLQAGHCGCLSTPTAPCLRCLPQKRRLKTREGASKDGTADRCLSLPTRSKTILDYALSHTAPLLCGACGGRLRPTAQHLFGHLESSSVSIGGSSVSFSVTKCVFHGTTSQ